MADVNTPFGKIPKWAVYGGVIGGGGALIYAYVKAKNKKTAAATAATSAATGAGYGYGYGSQAQYGYGTQYGYGAYTNDSNYGYGTGVDTAYGYGSYGSGISNVAPTQVTTNAEWTQQALSQLTNQGYSGTQVLTALGEYTTGQAVATANQPTVYAAIAVEGYPPVSGAGGYPPSIKTAATTGGGTGGGQTTNVTVPPTKGQSQEAGFAILSAAGLKATGTPVVKGKTLIVQSSSPAAGATVAKGSTVKLTSKVEK
jgi:hypothetical protein